MKNFSTIELIKKHEKEQIQEVYTETALQIEEVECVKVNIVKNDKTGKMVLVLIKVSDDANFKMVKKKVEQALGRFTINFEVL